MYNPVDWYWLMESGDVYSSARQVTCPPTDQEFMDWLAQGGQPSPYPRDEAGNESEAELATVLSVYGIAIGLSAYKAQTITRINEAAELCRGKYITPGDGQAMTYLEKISQARACLSAQSPQSADYPMLAAEIDITAPTLVGVAEVVVAAYNQWLVIGSAIEATRRAANVAAEAAETRDALTAILDGLHYPEGAPA